MPLSLPKPRELVGSLRRGLSWAWRGEAHRTYFDPFNPRGLSPVLAANGVAPLSTDPAQAGQGREGAARFVLGVYAASARLRRRFPQAFVDGAGDPFCYWLLANYLLAGEVARQVEALFAGGF